MKDKMDIGDQPAKVALRCAKCGDEVKLGEKHSCQNQDSTGKGGK